jgi:hypothetical protein
MVLSPRFVDATDPGGPTFSVCSLVTNADKYQRLLDTFASHGFTAENSEFLAADNRGGNQFDGFSWQKHLLAEARGRFVIFSHDDIELVDEGYDALLGWTRWLDDHAPKWLVAGIAGGVWHQPSQPKPALALRISDKFGTNRRKGTLPARVESLDECFLMMRRTRPVISSYDLTGFHFYGLDLCLQAELLGGEAHAINFHIRHTGQGPTGQPFRAGKSAFIQKYRQVFPARVLNTVNGVINLGPRDDPK